MSSEGQRLKIRQKPVLRGTYKAQHKALKVICRMFKILIIDPDISFRKSLTNQFPAAKLRKAGSGEKGLCQIDAFATQMIFIDILHQLPIL
jgi:hypothetical protein